MKTWSCFYYLRVESRGNTEGILLGKATRGMGGETRNRSGQKRGGKKELHRDGEVVNWYFKVTKRKYG